MPNVDLQRFLNEPIYAMDFQYMIGDIEDFLEFSELDIDFQYRRELLAIKQRAETEELPDGYEEHLRTNAEHRFTVSLPLRVRYGAVIALTTSVEWSVGFLVKALKQPLCAKPRGRDQTVHNLCELETRTGIGKSNVISDYEALVHIRNCIAHSAGIEAHYRYRAGLMKAVAQLVGFSLQNKHFLGRHVWIENGALTPYVREMSELIVKYHRAVDKQGLLQDS